MQVTRKHKWILIVFIVVLSLITFGLTSRNNPTAPESIKAHLQVRDHGVWVLFDSTVGGSLPITYEAQGGPGWHSKCQAELLDDGVQQDKTIQACELNLSNYQYVNIRVRASNQTGNSPWKYFRNIWVSDPQVERCGKVLTSWDVRLYVGFQFNQALKVKNEMENAGLGGNGASNKGRAVGDWIWQQVKASLIADMRGTPHTGDDSRDVSWVCEGFGAKEGTMTDFPIAPQNSLR